MGAKLSKRLEFVANFVTETRIADIGCDHGKLTEYLFENKIIEYALVSDVSLPSVKKAENLLKVNNRNFDWAFADGFNGVNEKHNVKQAIIAGMGGLEIIKILKQNKTSINKFVLQPQNNELKLKKYLLKNNYHILNDIIIKDKHIFYNVLRVEKKDSRQKISKFNLLFSNENFKNNADFYLYLQFLHKKYNKILISLPKLKRHKTKKMVYYVNKAINLWEKCNGKNITISKN